jgi:signal transduction histidine kinase/DNA-binding response OmpR family regulator
MLAPVRVVLLDDDPADREAARVALGGRFGDVELVAPDSRVEAERLLGGPPAAVVVTERAPWGFDAATTIEAIRGRWPDCPVVVWTRHGDERLAASTLRAGLTDYVSKAAEDLSALGAAVARAFERAHAATTRRRAVDRMRFLSDTTSALAATLHVDDAVSACADAVVPFLADACAIEVWSAEGETLAVAWRPAAPEAAPLVEAMRRACGMPRPGPGEPGPGRPSPPALFFPRCDAAAEGAGPAAGCASAAELARLGASSFMAVPLAARGRTIGTIALARTAPGRHFTTDELSLAEVLGRRAALAIDNARLYGESERARARIDALTKDLRNRITDIETLLDLIPIGIGIANDPACSSIRVNRAFARQLGIATSENASLTAPEAERPPFRVYRDGREVPPSELPMQRAARDGIEVRDLELDVVRADGCRVSLYEYAVPLFDEHGNTRGAIGAFLDITERKRQEERERFLGQASLTLAASLDLDATLAGLERLVVPSLADWCAIHLADRDGRVHRRGGTHADPARAPVLATIETRLAPDWVWRLAGGDVTAEGTLRRLDRIEAGWLAGRFPPDEAALLASLGCGSLLAVPLPGKGRPIGALTLVAAAPQRYGSGEIALVEELAFRFALALDNARLYEEAREASRLKDEFLATVSHELRTPLNAILGWTHLLRRGGLPPDTAARALEIIERNTIAQAVLIDDLLDVARVVTGKLRLHLAPLDVRAAVQAAVDAIRPAADAKAIAVRLEAQDEVGEVAGDADRLRQIIWNLLSNAVKFTPEGGRIDVRVAARGADVEIAVRDTGIGIRPEFLPHVFDRFRQADGSTTREHGGLGLGLAIVRHLVELHGGRIAAWSAGERTGATFTVRLPRQTAPAAGGATSSPPAEVGIPRALPSLAGLRILVVEDEDDARHLVEAVLASAGAEVRTAQTAAAAWRLLAERPPDVLVADLALPGEDGFALVRRLRAAEPPLSAVPAIALTAYAGASHRQAALAAGYNEHLAKPVEPGRLAMVVAALAARATR